MHHPKAINRVGLLCQLPTLQETDIATEQVHVGPEEVWEDNKMVSKGYLCTNTFTVQVGSGIITHAYFKNVAALAL